ncbi:metal-sensitive transcriptional regulator [Ancrocorticia populi]|uniref:Transcriptional regulator n=1 Tax=Ancrocorticia populi TaxID=2175228 RepID=A0A2V1JZX8_9ACTO|nr:metal-sensitive transcriptional regulator [Ancrocorticia populi]MDN6487725.1 metal-sensitive transcriptional regulator [Ancrocorticia sp.]PWF24506.1 transcriptional regulator [Ancrocorticia populi]
MEEAIGIQHDPEATRKIVNRLKRANGQLTGVIRLIDEGGNCRDVVQQIAAISKAVDRAGYLVIATAMRECVLSEDDSAESQKELEKIFLSLA